MSRIMRDFKCESCEHVFERLVDPQFRTVYCPVCTTGHARVMLSAPHIAYMKMGVDPVGCPTAADKWAKAHSQAARSDDR